MRRSSIGLVAFAALLSLFDASAAAYWTPAWFGYPQTHAGRAVIAFRVVLWIPAVLCSKFPRAGVAIFFTLLGAACVINIVRFAWSWQDGVLDLRFAILAGALLLMNALLVRKGSKATSTADAEHDRPV
jgi:hypothetical protein